MGGIYVRLGSSAGSALAIKSEISWSRTRRIDTTRKWTSSTSSTPSASSNKSSPTATPPASASSSNSKGIRWLNPVLLMISMRYGNRIRRIWIRYLIGRMSWGGLWDWRMLIGSWWGIFRGRSWASLIRFYWRDFTWLRRTILSWTSTMLMTRESQCFTQSVNKQLHLKQRRWTKNHRTKISLTSLNLRSLICLELI